MDSVTGRFFSQLWPQTRTLDSGMGVWSIPFESKRSANLFAKRMKKAWVAEVKAEEYPDFGRPKKGDIYKKDEFLDCDYDIYKINDRISELKGKRE